MEKSNGNNLDGYQNFTDLVTNYVTNHVSPLDENKVFDALMATTYCSMMNNTNKVFEVGENLVFLLEKTNSPGDSEDYIFPYNKMYVEFNDTFLKIKDKKQEFTCKGMQIDVISIDEVMSHTSTSEEFRTLEDKLGNSHFAGATVMFTLEKVGPNYTDNYIEFVFLDNKLYNYTKMDRSARKIWKKLDNILKNFLIFINDPDVEFVEIKRTEKTNERRIRQGKQPLPSSTKIKLNGKLKKYIEHDVTINRRKYQNSFWIRGHWRRLNSDHFINKKGTKIWIPPYVKGHGPLLKQMYSLEVEI
jgi:hypothetical protein